ncbi:glycoside hydrolase family 64 protein [Dothistroma septosporum NZE10]|uniref:Glycoside hydrolase family 64 protein n=1 Tax=Dothistroma septosporum (strain NZE10 / CBS 128990) TaxID=675120 RepID=N1PP19_DOTSN|nr:glycoside hydrolase family 64 protein [Dothistroma septosporum NZE10]
MHSFFTAFLAATYIVGTALAAPVVHRANDATPVMPGGVQDLVITKENTLNATSSQPVTNSTTGARAKGNILSVQANSRLPLALVNNMGGAVNAYVTGLDPSGKVVFVQSNGQFYYPPCDASYTTPREVTGPIAIPLNTAQGSTVTVTLPDYISSARIWFAQGSLHFYSVWNPATNSPSQVQPSFANPQDPSAGINWGFVELTNNSGGLYANLSFVDFVGLALGMSMRAGSGVTTTVRGLRTGSVSTICNALQSQQSSDGQPWASLCQSDGNGPLRVVAPNIYVSSGNGAFSNYFTSYIDQVWSQYTSNTLTISTQSGAGNVACRVSGSTLTCDGDNRAYNKPTVGDIWGCNSGTFAIQGGDNDVHRAVVPRLCAAFNRGTLFVNGGNTQPGPAASEYYTTSPNNQYSRIVHQQEVDGRGYAFSYDDVNPSGGVDQSGTLADGNPQLLTVYVGGA